MINKITFVPNKPFGKILEIALTHFITLETFNSQFQINEVWFTDKKSQPLEVEDRINLTLVIKYIQLNPEIEYMLKHMDFCLLLKTWAKV